MKKKLIFLFVGSFILSMAFYFFCLYRFSTFSRPTIVEMEAMGTLNQIKIFDEPRKAQAAATEIQVMLGYLESKTNLLDPHSEIGVLNQRRNMVVSPELFSIIERCLYYAEWSHGVFDPTVGALTLAYKVGEGQALPSAAELAKLRLGVDYHFVKINAQTREVALSNPLTKLDVWGAAKGYAADQALAILKKRKIRAAMIDLGGQVSVWGKRPMQAVWNVGVEDPRAPDHLLAMLVLKSGDTLATSSAAQRFDAHGHKIAGHIFDPHTGLPVASMKSVSIVSQSGLDADIMSTTIFVLGTVQALQELHSFRYLTLDAHDKILQR